MPRPTRKTDLNPPAHRIRFEHDMDRWTVLNALRTAAATYDRDAETMKAHGAAILVDTFERQARDARELYDRIEAAPGFDD